MIKKLYIFAILMTISPLVWADGCDSNTVLLLHMDGSDTSTTFTDENCDGSGAHTMTANGNAQIDTGIAKFAQAGLFDGTGDYLTSADSADWDIFGSSSTNYTMEAFVYLPAGLVGDETLLAQTEDEPNRWVLEIQSNETIRLRVRSGGTHLVLTASTTALSTITWQHVAVCKEGSSYGVYIDGTQDSYQSTASTDTFAGTFYVADNGFTQDLKASIDEVRIQNDVSSLGCSPNSGKTDTFTPTTVAYSVSSSRRIWNTTKYDAPEQFSVWKRFVKTERGYDRQITTYNFIPKGREL